MAFRTFIRFVLLTPVQIALFLLISLPLALFAGITTFFSVIFLSSRLFFVYVDLLFSVLFASSSNSGANTAASADAIKLRSQNALYPLSIPRSPPRSPPRSGGAYRARQQSFTAPSSPNISRKRLSAGAYGAQQQQQQSQQSQQGGGNNSSSSSSRQASLSPPLTMRSLSGKAPKSTPSTPFGNPPPYSTHENTGRPKNGKKGPVKIAEPGDDYFSGVRSRS
ncbi:hypothetical protein H072_2552 [Dactylellina haptotyla CBS 200.50]|uniref:Uncharacterized protein n=1 Tax=Dactylellina haptotyla (strain CBS 200.50) TaxID=1284197 RepID=S8C6Y2_DACHA|nr:hypothetical protein H072_2552 [Dactylellina haptotyla CBS 200.50]